MPLASTLYLVLLGFMGGIVVVTMTSYCRVSPPWLRWLLYATGVLLISRYVSMALFAAAYDPASVWGFRRCWLASTVGLTLPSVMVIDQLLRHPAMSPRKLLIWFSPFLAVYAAVILFGSMEAAEDPFMGWSLTLAGPWGWVLGAVQAAFFLGFAGIVLLLIRKVPTRSIRVALGFLLAAHTYLAVDGLLVAAGHWYFRPHLFSELLTLLAIRYAYETSAELSSSPMSLS